MSSTSTFTAPQPDGTVSLINLSTPGAYQDFAFEAEHADGRLDRFAAYHTGERAIFIDVLTRLAAGRSAEVVLADIACIRNEVATRSAGCTPSPSPPFRPMWEAVRSSSSVPFSNSYSIDGRSRRVGLTITGDKHGLRFSERRGRERGFKVVIASEDLWRFAAGMMLRTYEDPSSLPLSRVGSDEYQDALDGFESIVEQRP